MYHFRPKIKIVFEESENQAFEQYSNVNSRNKRVHLRYYMQDNNFHKYNAITHICVSVTQPHAM